MFLSVSLCYNYEIRTYINKFLFLNIMRYKNKILLPGFEVPEGIVFPRNRANWVKSKEPFPIDQTRYKPVTIDLSRKELTIGQIHQLKDNIAFGRDAIVAFTAIAGAKGLGGHTGGAYDIMTEGEITTSIMRGCLTATSRMAQGRVHGDLFDEAGHRVAYQYLRAAINGDISFGDLLHYREAGMGLPGHPEPEMTPGIVSAGGRLGHMPSEVNGIALAYPNQNIIMLGSDGSQQEDRVAGAARFAVQQKLKVLWVIDDNDVTIRGHPRTGYLNTFSLEKTLRGHGFRARVLERPDDNLQELYKCVRRAILTNHPYALILRRDMAPGIEGIQGTPEAHDVISADCAINYLKKRSLDDAIDAINHAKTQKSTHIFTGIDEKVFANRSYFGTVVSDILDELGPDKAKKTVKVIDSDLEGSCGLTEIRKRHPAVYIQAPINESGNFATAAAFGSAPDRQGIFSTFGAFQEMTISEITMARLNNRRAIIHYSHTGLDDMADNNCHAGINMFFADNGVLEGKDTRLYSFADINQMDAGTRGIWDDPGLRFIYTTRSKTPKIMTEDGKEFFSKENNYEFRKDKDEIIREGTAGYVVAYGECLYRALEAVDKLREEGKNVGLINKSTLNTWDEETMEKLKDSPFTLVVEGQNYTNGLGSRMGTEILMSGTSTVYDHMGITKSGIGGLGFVQMKYQGLDSDGIYEKAKAMHLKSN